MLPVPENLREVHPIDLALFAQAIDELNEWHAVKAYADRFFPGATSITFESTSEYDDEGGSYMILSSVTAMRGDEELVRVILALDNDEADVSIMTRDELEEYNAKLDQSGIATFNPINHWEDNELNNTGCPIPLGSDGIDKFDLSAPPKMPFKRIFVEVAS